MKVFCNFSNFRPLAWLIASLLAGLIAGCGGGVDGGGMGTIGVSLTDAPACGFDEVNVTVNKVRVHQRSSASEMDVGWTDITLNPARKINLLGLNNGTLDYLGDALLPAGHYTHLRLVLDPNTSNGLANSIVLSGATTEIPLVTPSAVKSGIKIINEFDVLAGQHVGLVMDFNACKSIVKRGNGSYALKPVIKVLPYELNGIDGYIDAALLGSNVMVTAQQNGDVIQSTVPNPITGKFFLTRLLPGDYDVVVTADDHAMAVISAVPVATAISIVSLSGDVARITLPSSLTHTVSGTAELNPTSSTEVAYVTAKQTLGSVPVATVKFVAADDTSTPPGAYSLTLPADAPLLGQYTALPIVLTAQSGVVGQYTIEATAAGYKSQSVVKDMSTLDVTESFTLVP